MTIKTEEIHDMYVQRMVRIQARLNELYAMDVSEWAFTHNEEVNYLKGQLDVLRLMDNIIKLRYV